MFDKLLLFAFLSAPFSAAWAQTEAVGQASESATPASPPRPFPCEEDAAFRAFDFWIGDWDVRLADGTLAGHNRILSAEHGCVLTENWTSVTGNTGASVNFLDKTTDEWVQIWNDAGGSQIHIRGGMTEDGMLLAGKIHYVGNGTTASFRGLWTPLPDGRVRQFFEQSNDGGENWSPWFEGFYSRRSAAKSTDKDLL